MNDAIKRWRARQQIKQETRNREKRRQAELLTFFVEMFEPFKGKMFQVHTNQNWSNSRLLRKFEPKNGLGEDIYGLHEKWPGDEEEYFAKKLNQALQGPTPFQKEQIKLVPEGEYVMATGNVIARRIKPEKDCKQHIIHAIEVITTKGFGYLRRDILKGPLEQRSSGPQLIWDRPKNNSNK